MTSSTTTIAVVGLGYVGLPLAVEFGKKFRTIGFDLSQAKVDAYRRFVDPTGEVATEDLRRRRCSVPTTDAAALAQADFIVVAVPTPIDDAHQPDFRPLLGASEAVGRNMKRGATIVFESTVYPGATEEICVPVIEKHSGMKWKRDFFVGYSPERINPGDREHTLTRITKVVSGDTPETLERVAEVYGSIVTAGVHRASSIKVAEAAKVIENTQRDLNIALMNELSLIFHEIGIDTLEVLETAGTKWNFLPFRPGLVGGHCIGVDPYYLTHKADMLGYHPQVILAGRRINDGMGKYIAEQTVKQLIQVGRRGARARTSTCSGLTFKENCPDLRNSRVIDVMRELESFGAVVHVHDPVADPDEARHEYGVALEPWERLPRGDAIVAAVAHRAFRERPLDDFVAKLAANGLYVDVKSQADAARCARAASPSGDSDADDRSRVPDAFAAARTSLRERPLRWLVTGSAGFIGSHLLEALLRLEQEVVEHRQFRDRPPAQPRRGARRGRRRTVAAPHVPRGRHRRSRSLPSRPAKASTSCCTRRRSARCRVRSRIRCERTRPTRPGSSTCSSPRATPASRASSTRRRVRRTATIRRCRRSRTASAARCRPTRSPSSSTSCTPTCSAAATGW